MEEGQSYLEENGLVASDPEHEGHALLPGFQNGFFLLTFQDPCPNLLGGFLCFRLRLF